MASAKKKSSSKGPSPIGKRVSARAAAVRDTRRKASTAPDKHFAVCVCNDGYRASLELRKLYQVLPDDFANEHDMVRVVDESGEDYLFPNTYFVRIELPRSVEQALEKIA